MVLKNNFYSTIEQRVIDLISWSTRIPSTRIHPYSDLSDDLLLDEYDKLLLIAELESLFDVYLTPEEIAHIHTVQDASAFFRKSYAA